MISHAAMMSKCANVNAKLSAYDHDLMSLDACKKYKQKQGNSWKQAFMNEIDNLKKLTCLRSCLCRASR